MDGLFIAFEGGEGSGKTTQAQLLKEWFSRSGRSVTLTREPGGTELGVQLRRILLDLSSNEVAVKTEALLFAADRAEHMATLIHPALTRRDVVISDRYIDSFLAYENGGREFHSEDLLRIARWATDALVPDLTILLDISPQTGLSRRGELDRMESQPLDFHERVRTSFLDLAAGDPTRYLVIDADQPTDVIAEIIQRRCRMFTNA
jgi:dTMP kinase